MVVLHYSGNVLTVDLSSVKRNVFLSLMVFFLNSRTNRGITMKIWDSKQNYVRNISWMEQNLSEAFAHAQMTCFNTLSGLQTNYLASVSQVRGLIWLWNFLRYVALTRKLYWWRHSFPFLALAKLSFWSVNYTDVNLILCVEIVALML